MSAAIDCLNEELKCAQNSKEKLILDESDCWRAYGDYSTAHAKYTRWLKNAGFNFAPLEIDLCTASDILFEPGVLEKLEKLSEFRQHKDWNLKDLIKIASHMHKHNTK